MSKKHHGTPGPIILATLAYLLVIANPAVGQATAPTESETSSVVPLPATSDFSATTQPASAPVVTMPVGPGGAMPLPASKDPGMTALNWNDTNNSTGLTNTTLLSSLVILVLGGVALFFVRRILPRITGGGSGGGLAGARKKRMRVLETAHMGPRKALHLVSVSGRTLLLAGCGDQLKLLADLTSEPILNAEREPDSPSQEAVTP